MSLFQRTNDALNINPVAGVDEALSVHGSDWLWAVTAIYLVTFVSRSSSDVLLWKREQTSLPLPTFVLLVGRITYYAQASNLGWSAVEHIDGLGNGVMRQIFCAMYINWAVAFPFLALAMGLVSGVSWTTIICNVAIAYYWAVSYLVAAYTLSTYKWGFFTFGTFSWVILAASTLNECREPAAKLGIERDYMILSVWLNILWLLYPVAFSLGDGGNYIDITTGTIFSGVLDILTVPVLTFAFLFFARTWDFQKLSIAFSDARLSKKNKGSRRRFDKAVFPLSECASEAKRRRRMPESQEWKARHDLGIEKRKERKKTTKLTIGATGNRTQVSSATTNYDNHYTIAP
ncbi:hypothetical protein BJX63DRAFT_431967 [Aspergillus granulosus]|uniref:Uncharacterized protein n=1 Tax=Aspergillus granulosus TaxID=176169 RepID=A0ABR4HD31_9EURO